MEWRQNNYLASDDKALLGISEIVALLNELYPTEDYSSEKVQKIVNNSFCVGLYSDGKLVGFVRIITDKITLSWIKDFIIEKDHRRKGLGSFIMNCLLAHPDLSETDIVLGAQDARDFYKKFGFDYENFMTRDAQS